MYWHKKSKCLYLLSTNTSLKDTEIVRIYGNRWSIECFFKASKSFLKLGSEFQSRSYGAMVSHTTIVFTRYIILEWLRRNQNDEKTYGEIFFMYCEVLKCILLMVSFSIFLPAHLYWSLFMLRIRCRILNHLCVIPFYSTFEFPDCKRPVDLMQSTGLCMTFTIYILLKAAPDILCH